MKRFILTLIASTAILLAVEAQYTVTLQAGTEGAADWSIAPAAAAENETVTINYAGARRVKEIKVLVVPDAPDLSGNLNVTGVTAGMTDGSITILMYVDSTMEYSIDGGITWIPMPSDGIIPGLDTGEVLVRTVSTDDTPASKPYVVHVKPAPVVTAPTPALPTYNGGEQALVNAGTADGGELQYSLDGVDWSPTIPTATNAGNYTVYYKAIPDADHLSNSFVGSVNAPLAKADPMIAISAPDYTFSSSSPIGNYAVFTISYNGDGIINNAYSQNPNVVSVNRVDASLYIYRQTFTSDSCKICVTSTEGLNYKADTAYMDVRLLEYDGIALAGSQVGYSVSSNGKAYAPGSGTGNGVPIGVVAFKSGSSGIILALNDWNNGALCDWNSAQTVIQVIGGRSFRVGYEYEYQICGVTSYNWNTLNTQLTGVGGTPLSGNYWTITSGVGPTDYSYFDGGIYYTSGPDVTRKIRLISIF